MTDFDWLALGNFQPLDNTLDLGSQLEEEPTVFTSQDDMPQEEHYILSAIGDVDDLDNDEQEIVLLEPPAVTPDVPPPMFANVVVLDYPLLRLTLTFYRMPLLRRLKFAVFVIVTPQCRALKMMDLDDEGGPPPPVEPDVAVVPLQEVNLVDIIHVAPQEVVIVEAVPHDNNDVDVIEVVPQAPDSPISLHSDDDESLSDFRVRTVVTHWLHWDHRQPRNFLTRPESRNIRQYIRYLRSQIQTMRLRLQTRIDQLRRYHGDIFHSNFEFGIQRGDTELARPPTDRRSVAYYHYWRFYYQVRLDLVFNRNSRILRPLQGYFAQRHSQWDVAGGNTYDARYQLFHPTAVHGSGWPDWRRRQIERFESVMSLSSMDPNMVESNEWSGSQRPNLWHMSVHGVRSVYGRLPYLRAPMLHRRPRLVRRRRQWGRIRGQLLEHRQRWERLDLMFVREVGSGAGRIFSTGGNDPQWDYVFPLWESNPAHLLQCMDMIVSGYEVQFDYRLTLTPAIRTMYDNNLNLFLRWRLWHDYYYHPYSDHLLTAIFNPIRNEVGMVMPGLDWRFLSPQIKETAEIETPEELDMIGHRWDVHYSLDRTTFHRVQHQCLNRATSIDVGVLQVVDYINGYGYTFWYRSRAAIIVATSDELEITPYRVLS